MTSRIAVLTQGHTDPLSAKTAVSLLRYRGDQVVALVDADAAGQTTQALLGCGGDTPIVAALGDIPGGADTLVIGIAPAGGKLPDTMRSVVLDAVGRGMDVTSGMHQFLTDDPEIREAARHGGGRLWDVRKNDERDIADRLDINPGCLRIHAVGQDCSCGKMVASVEVAIGLQARGQDAKFVATGQSGILVASGVNAGIEQTDAERHDPNGGGAPTDCIPSDFVNGAAEALVKRNQHHDIIVIEGQASLVHPSYSSLTYGLLHATLPHGLILCYEAGRPHTHGRPHLPLTPLRKIVEIYEYVSNLEQPCKFIGVAMNSRLLASDDEFEAERELVGSELGLPVCDVVREGPGRLVQAVIDLRSELGM